MNPLRLVLLVALALALAGCGSGGDGMTFAADANALCKKRIDAIDKATEGGKGGPDSDAAIVEAYETELEDLRHLSPPDSDADAYEKMLGNYEEGSDLVGKFAGLREQAAKATDRETYNEKVDRSLDAIQDSRRARSQGNKVAKDLGLDTCSTPLY